RMRTPLCHPAARTIGYVNVLDVRADGNWFGVASGGDRRGRFRGQRPRDRVDGVLRDGVGIDDVRALDVGGDRGLNEAASGADRRGRFRGELTGERVDRVLGNLVPVYIGRVDTGALRVDRDSVWERPA